MIGITVGVLGLILTLVFGGYSIWIHKKSKKNVSLEFINKECYSLFREDVNRLNIELIYNKTVLNNTIILLKAKLINNGHVDIDKNRIFNPLKIKSSKAYKWLEATVKSSPSGAKTSVELLTGQEIQLNWDLLKQNEYIEIEALVEITGDLEKEGEKGTDFYNNLTFDYRITDLNLIQKEKQISNSIRRKKFFDKIHEIFPIVVILLGAIFLSFEFYPSLNIIERHVVSYVVKNNNNDLFSIISANNASDKIVLSIDGVDKKREISVKDFNESYQLQRINKIVLAPENKMFNRIFGVLYLFLGGLMLLLKMKKRPKKLKEI